MHVKGIMNEMRKKIKDGMKAMKTEIVEELQKTKRK
jgi:hypothetical protein